jgi:FkbM family methyltransferase
MVLGALLVATLLLLSSFQVKGLGQEAKNLLNAARGITTVQTPNFKQETCSLPSTTRSVVMSAFVRPFRFYLHPQGKDIHVSDSIARNAETGNYFEWHIRNQMEKRMEELSITLGRKPLVLDIGGNIGIHALYFASKGYEVHAFEPMPANFALLQCSASVNDFRTLKVNNVGLGSKDAELCMDVPDGRNQGHALIVAAKLTCKNKVKVIRLVDYIANELQGRTPDFIKIDIEGYEMTALSTIKELLMKGKKPKYIFSEFYAGNMRDHGIKPVEYYDFLTSMGYEVYNSKTNILVDRSSVDKATIDIVAIGI